MQKRMLLKPLNKSKYLLFKTVIYLSITSCIIGCDSCTGSKQKYGQKLINFNNKLNVQWDEKLSPEIDKWFNSAATKTRFNGNLLVAIDGKVIYQNSHGFSNYGKKDTLSLITRFQIASVSKTFTSMAIMILKERGLLKYDDLVTKYFPEFPYKDITIRLLLTHRSGLPNYNYFCDAYTDKETVIYNKDVLKFMIDSVPVPYYPPDYKFNYCNTNYVLLALIVEKIDGRSFQEFAKEEIFEKAGMHSTRIYINGEQSRIPFAATGYHYRWTEALPTYQDGVIGDKGVYTTIADLWRWSQALDNNTLVDKKTLNEAFIPQSKDLKGNRNYGFGWRILNMIDSSQLIYHGGWWRGFNSLFARDIKNNAVIIVLSNVRTRAFYFLSQELIGIIDPKRWNMQLEMDSLYLKQKGLNDSTRISMEL